MSIRYALLGPLAQRPCHSYGLHAAFEAVLGGEGNWVIKPAPIYTTLAIGLLCGVAAALLPARLELARAALRIGAAWREPRVGYQS